MRPAWRRRRKKSRRAMRGCFGFNHPLMVSRREAPFRTMRPPALVILRDAAKAPLLRMRRHWTRLSYDHHHDHDRHLKIPHRLDQAGAVAVRGVPDRVDRAAAVVACGL